MKQFVILTTLAVVISVAVADKSLDSTALPIQSTELNDLRTPRFEQPGTTVEPEADESEGRALDKLKIFAGGDNNQFIKPRLLNTSIALTIPLFSFSLPAKGGSSPTTLANQVKDSFPAKQSFSLL